MELLIIDFIFESLYSPLYILFTPYQHQTRKSGVGCFTCVMKLTKKQLDLIYPRVRDQIRNLCYDHPYNFFRKEEDQFHVLTSREVFSEMLRLYFKNTLFFYEYNHDLKGSFAGYMLKTGSFYGPFILFMMKDRQGSLHVVAVYDILYDETHQLGEKQKLEIRHKVFMLFEKQTPVRLELLGGVFFKKPSFEEFFQDNVLKVIQEIYPSTLARRISHVCDLAMDQLSLFSKEHNETIKRKSYKKNDGYYT